MKDIIIVLFIVIVIGAALLYLIRAKRRGEKCIGCPYSKQCGGSCHSAEKTEENEKKQNY